MSKLYKLFIGNEKKVPAAVSNDKWLLELFIAQRGMSRKDISIDKVRIKPKDAYNYDDNYLLYYFGYSITNYEYRYVLDMLGEYTSELELRIFEMESSYAMHKRKMTHKERKSFKKAIKTLKRIDYSDSKRFASEMIDTILNRRGMICDYMENLQMFKDCMGGF